MIPKRIEVIRLYERDKIDDKIFDPKKVDINSEKWVSISDKRPETSGIFFLKNNKVVFKGIYLHAMPYVTPSNWFHCIKNEFINDELITYWMQIK